MKLNQLLSLYSNIFRKFKEKAINKDDPDYYPSLMWDGYIIGVDWYRVAVVLVVVGYILGVGRL